MQTAPTNVRFEGETNSASPSMIFGHDLFSDEAKTKRLAHMTDRL